MSDSVQPRVCVITGGSSGIGLATALEFARHGDRVAICGRDVSRLDLALTKIGKAASTKSDILSLPIDVGEAGSVTKFVSHVQERWGRVDILFNNAGYPPRDDITGITREQFDQAINVNVAATFEGVQAVWPGMRSRGQGVIVNMSSMAAIDPFPGFSVYGACKAWVELFSKAMATEGEPLGIRVVCVRPGAVETPMLRGLFPDFPDDQLVSAEEVARVAFRLCERDAQLQDGPVTVAK